MVYPSTGLLYRLKAQVTMVRNGGTKIIIRDNNGRNTLCLGKSQDKWLAQPLLWLILFDNLKRALILNFPFPQKQPQQNRYSHIVCTSMASSSASLPKIQNVGNSQSQEVSPIARSTPHCQQHVTKQMQLFYTRLFKRNPIGTSEEGCPLTRVELDARQETHHLFVTTSTQKQLTLLNLDQECHKLPTAPMNIRAKAFPWKIEEFCKTIIPTQFYKLFEFYWMLCSFVAQSMQQ